MPSKKTLDISKLSIPEMNALKADIDAEMQSRRKDQIKVVAQQIRKILQENGMTVEDIFGKKTRTNKVAPKYACPSDPSMTWTGRGRKPRWVVDHLNKGGKISDIEL